MEKEKRQIYEELLMERDQLRKEGVQSWITYKQMFGQLTAEVFEEQVACIRCKKTIGFLQKARNWNNAVNAEELDNYLERVMRPYKLRLDRMLRDAEAVKETEVATPYEVKRSKELYRRLARMLHPDLNPWTDESETLQELWLRVQDAYDGNDVKTLLELEVLVRKELREVGWEGEDPEIADLDDRIRETEEEIEQIRNTEPYTLKDLVCDPEKCAAKREELEKELTSFREYHSRLKQKMLALMQEGGIEIHVDGTDD